MIFDNSTDHQSQKRGEKVVTRHPTGNPIEPSCIRTGIRIHVCLVVSWPKPTRIIGLGQQGTEKGWAVLQPTQRHPRETRRRVGSYVQRPTEMRNGVTPCRAQR